MLGIGTRTIERALSDGVFPVPPLPSIGAGRQKRRRLFSRAAIERWVDHNGGVR